MKMHEMKKVFLQVTRNYIHGTTSITDWVAPESSVRVPIRVQAWDIAVRRAFPPQVAAGVRRAIQEQREYVAQIIQLAGQTRDPLAQKRQLEEARHQP